MSKSFEALPDFNYGIETVTFLRLLADDIENGIVLIRDASLSKYWYSCSIGISINIETIEKRL